MCQLYYKCTQIKDKKEDESKVEINKVYSKESVEGIFDQKREFVIVALTGKINAGTSDVCRLLTDKKFCDRVTKLAETSEYQMSESRERNVCYRYLHHNWRPFIKINVSSVILSFLLESEADKIRKIIINKNNNKNLMEIIKEYISSSDFKYDVKRRLSYIDSIICGDTDGQNKKNNGIDENQLILFLNTLQNGILINEIEYMSMEGFFFYYGVLPSINKYLEGKLRKTRKYTALYQQWGNYIRAYGVALPDEKNYEYKSEGMFAIPSRVNSVMKILRHYLELKNKNDVFNNQNIRRTNTVFVLIDNFKNYFEAIYFRARYASFYLLAVTCDENMRKERFDDYTLYKNAELIENLKSGKNLYKKAKKIVNQEEGTTDDDNIKDINKYQNRLNEVFSDAEIYFIKKLYSEPGGKIRRACYENNLADFVLQDVVKCVENADLFLLRNFKQEDVRCDRDIIWQLGRMVTLMLHPALLTPTKVERCMQMAVTAKLNSGCLSRQVGAVVTDSEYNILSLGWNDAPCGAESCIRRNMFDLFRNHDNKAYSEYELHDIEFRRYLNELEKILDEDKKRNLKGLPYAFCFKEIYQDILGQKDQIYTRALHGEERALAMCGNERAKGGNLFTTSSPCELCAKKIKEAGIKKIYYIEQYKGISKENIIDIGNNRAEFILFTGAIGEAYIKLYTPLMSYKDELKAIGYDPVELYKKQINSRYKESEEQNNENYDEIIEGDLRQVQQTNI